MSRNKDRLGEAPFQDDAPIQQMTENSNINWIVPTVMVDIPSKGKLYSDNHPLKNIDSVEIRELTANEEDILNNKTLLRKNIAIERMLQSILVNKNIKIDDLLLGDQNALIINARISGYGKEYDAKMTCPGCNQSVEYKFDLSQYQSFEGPTKELLDQYNAELTKDNTLLLNMPRSGQQWEVKFFVGTDEKWITKQQEMKEKQKIQSAPITDQLFRATIAIDGQTEPQNIRDSIKRLLALDSRYFRLAHKALTPHLELKQEFVCPNSNCGHSELVDVPLGRSFFWPVV